MPRFLELTPPKICFGLSLAWHCFWASTVAAPSDWDPSYYLAVARHIAAGDGAVTDAVWNLGWLPPAIRHPADLHWMPLPSRVLVPFVALAGDRRWPAAQLCTVLIAAAWAPLGWAWAGRLQAQPHVRWSAALIAGLAGGYVRTITTPDSIALYGLIGGSALLAASRKLAVTIPLVALAALTRGDGFLLGLACFLAWRKSEAISVALAGIVAAAAWFGRCWLLAGEGWISLRTRVADSLNLQQILVPEAPLPPTLAQRGEFLLAHLPTVAAVTLVVTGGVLIWPALLELVKRRSDAGLWPIPAYAVGFPIVIHVLAPAIAAEGSVYRSGAALFVPCAALAAVGAANLTRRYHPMFLPGMLVVSTLVSAIFSGRQYERVLTQLGGDCEALAPVPKGAPVLSYDPIGVEARCGNPGVILARGLDPNPLAERWGIDWALVAPAGYDNGTTRAEDWQGAGWEPVSDRLYRRRPARLRTTPAPQPHPD